MTPSIASGRSASPEGRAVSAGPEQRAGTWQLIGLLAWTACAVGALVGVVEVAWSYWLPMFSPHWRAVLPATIPGLLGFLAIASVTDTVLGLVGAVVPALGLVLLGWVGRRRPDLGVARFRIRVLLLAGAAIYVLVGWLGLFVLPSGERHTWMYQAIVLLVAGLGALAALGICLLLRSIQRRRRVSGSAVWCAAMVFVVVLTLPAFLSYRSQLPQPVQLRPASVAPTKNVLLITLDTLRADYLGCYGNPWIRTPALDALAAKSFLFENAIAQAPTTGPSHSSIMTSVYPFDHGAENGRPMKPELITLAEIMRTNGYETVAFTSATTTRSISSGLHKGFDKYVDSLVPWAPFLGRDEFQHLLLFYAVGLAQDSQIGGDVVTERALDWLGNRSGKPFFAWLHYFDPHRPYGSPKYHDAYKGRIVGEFPMMRRRERYAEDVTFTDDQVHRVIEALRERELYDNTIVIVVSDHGEGFGERHGEIEERDHGLYLYDTTQHVPLIVKPAGVPTAGHRIRRQVELVDIAPTVLALLGVDAPDQFQGEPLIGLVGGAIRRQNPRPAYSFNTPAARDPRTVSQGIAFVQQYAVRTPGWKYITIPRTGHAELYDLTADPAERYNVLNQHREVGAQHQSLVSRFFRPDADSLPSPQQRVAPALLRQLRSLGYLGDTSEDPDGDGEESSTRPPPADTEEH